MCVAAAAEAARHDWWAGSADESRFELHHQQIQACRCRHTVLRSLASTECTVLKNTCHAILAGTSADE